VSQYGVYLNYLIVIAVGFSVSGVVSSLYRMVTSEQPEFLPFSMAPKALLFAFLLSMFAGPSIIAAKIWNGLGSEKSRAPLLMAALLAICGLWSFYSGVFILYFSYFIV
jgi:hypothetical protein